MKASYQDFLETIETHNSRKVFASYSKLGEYDYTDCSVEQLEQIILNMKPNSPKAIITICYVLSAYAKFSENMPLYQLIQSVDKQSLWKKAKPSAAKKFISHQTFEEVYHDIGIIEPTNSFYYQTLFRCIYEGIYCDDMSVLKNLRGSDVHGNIVQLHNDDGETYELEISLGLAEDLKELGQIDTWERINRYGMFQMKIEGLYLDSCFKVENRQGSSEYAYRYSYYRVLRKIAKEYLEYSLLPLQLFVSGIMRRIGLKLQENGISVEEAFADQNRNRLVSKIISDELQRCHYNIEVRNFRQMVIGHLDVFKIAEG